MCGEPVSHPATGQVYHIRARRNYPKLRYVKRDGVVLCTPCHKFADYINFLQDVTEGRSELGWKHCHLEKDFLDTIEEICYNT